MADFPEDVNENESATQVFCQDLLREIILDLAIHLPNNKICRKTLISLREVQKSWRNTISHVLHRKKEPLYTLRLDERNSLNRSAQVIQHGKALDRFINFFGDRDDFIKLKLCEEFFRLENFDSLSNALKSIGNCLVELDLSIPLRVGSFPGMLPHLGLPNLHNLYVKFSRKELENLEYDSVESICSTYTNTTMLLQSLLVQAPNLMELFFYISRSTSLSAPLGLQYLFLPSTIQKMNLHCALSDLDLQILHRNQLPVLSSLYLELACIPLPRDVIFPVFDRFKETLTVVHVEAKAKAPQALQENIIKLPEMKNLKALAFVRLNVVLDEDTKQNLGARLPKLKRLDLHDQTPAALNSWSDGTSLEVVEQLGLRSIDAELQPETRGLCTLPTPATMSNFLHSMPNVRKLTLFTRGPTVVNLGTLFPKLEVITELKITTQTEKAETSDLWNSLLTGIPLDVVKGLRLNPDFEQNFSITVRENEAASSVRLLKNLSTLSLNDKTQSPTNRQPLLSGLSFKFALLKMPSLQNLDLHGRFQISTQLADAWIKAGRSISQTSIAIEPPNQPQ